jgi:hypothetical protein
MRLSQLWTLRRTITSSRRQKMIAEAKPPRSRDCTSPHFPVSLLLWTASPSRYLSLGSRAAQTRRNTTIAKASSRSPSKLPFRRHTRSRLSLPCTPARRPTAPHSCQRPYTHIFRGGGGRRPAILGSRGCRQRIRQRRRQRSRADPVLWKPNQAPGFLQLLYGFATNTPRTSVRRLACCGHP